MPRQDRWPRISGIEMPTAIGDDPSEPPEDWIACPRSSQPMGRLPVAGACHRTPARRQGPALSYNPHSWLQTMRAVGAGRAPVGDRYSRCPREVRCDDRYPLVLLIDRLMKRMRRGKRNRLSTLSTGAPLLRSTLAYGLDTELSLGQLEKSLSKP